MTHNPFANAHPVGGRVWTEQEEAILLRMLAEGATKQQIADSLSGRSLASVKCHIRYMRLPAEQKAEEERRQKRSRLERKRGAPSLHAIKRVSSEVGSPVVPPEVLEQRNRRLMAPRDLTAILLGDPAPGFSALERRA
jgi:hypothetical protein